VNILTTNVEKKTYISGGKTKGIAFAAAFGALMAATGGFSIPLIVIPVPITFQVFFVYLAGTIGGPVYGALSIIIYLALGTIGLPVFSGFSGGIAHLLGPTGGYLFAFPVATFFAGIIARRAVKDRKREWLQVTLAMLFSLIVVYSIGVTWLSTYLGISLTQAFVLGALPFIPIDLVKLLIAAPIAIRLRKTLATVLFAEFSIFVNRNKVYEVTSITELEGLQC